MKNRCEVVLTRRGAWWETKNVTVDNVWRTGNPDALAGI